MIQNCTKIELEEFLKLEDLYINTFNDLLENNLEYWKYAEELSILTNTTLTQVYNIIENCEEFVMNSNGKITTRKIYKNKTSFWCKLMNQFMNQIK